ncbi:AraC family transcriptional regulator [Paenibacillus thailandensis]|uniref:AraC family transcriptional regulator n=1 Tax=Paenibacillus thailandensis TaxID=393250 RepID=A0ABW5QV21_9BACL
MKRSKTFYNIFIPILVLGVGLVVSFGSYIYISTIHSVVERVADGKQSLIVQIRNTLEQKIQTIEYAFSTYSTTKSFSDIIHNPLTPRDFEAYRELNTQLNYIATMGLDGGVSYSLISLEKNWKLSGGSLSRLTEEERSALYDNYIEQKSQDLFWVKTEDGIRFVQTLPVFTKNKQAIALSDISLSALNHTLQSEAGMRVYILNKQGELLYAAESGEPGLTDSQLKQIGEQAVLSGGTGEVKLNGDSGGDITAVYAASSYNNWTYVTVLDRQEVTEALKTTRIGLIVMGVLLILLMVVAAYVLALRFAEPIQKIRSKLQHGNQPVASDEVDWIIRSIDSIVSEKESMESFLRSEMPKLETQFIQNLLRGRLSREETDISLKRFGYRWPGSPQYAALLVQLDNYGDRQASDRDVLLLAVNKIAGEIVPPSGRMLPILLDERTQATILVFGEEASEPDIRKQTIGYAKQLIHKAREVAKLSVSIGISRTYDDLLLSKEAAEMGKQALHHRLHLGKESIIFYDDISTVIVVGAALRYPSELEAKLFDAIRLGDELEVSRSLYPFLAEVMKHGKNTMNFEVTLIRFVNNLIQLEQHIGTDVLLTPDHSTLYHRLLDTRNPEEIERMLVQEVIQPMVGSMKEKTNRQFRSISDKIASIVRAEFDRDLSLESISERLHYSPNYLSSIFKKEYGMTFSDYLMNYRLDIARKWLTETDMTIKDIAERLRYQNPQNFIRSFRKKEHVTPGAYRKAMLDR